MKEPMCAVVAPAKIQFPVYASVKIDGIRSVVKDGILLSRTLKPIPNVFVQDTLGTVCLEGLDSELTVGPPNAPDCMQRTTSGVMSRDGEPDFTSWVFDYWTEPTVPYAERLVKLQNAFNGGYFKEYPRIKLLSQILMHNQAELDDFEERMLADGYEGVMIRSPAGLYKYGRSTAREGYLLKVKRFVDAEAVVIGFEERMHNANEATIDERGFTKRSSHQENKVPMDTLGALVVKDLTTGITFSVGTGFVDAERKYIWDNRQMYIDKYITYKHFKVTGVKDAPRFPVFKAFRAAIDVKVPQ